MLPLYRNIKKRRTELDISQQELAELVGYKSKSMISQVENGTVDLSLTMIAKFASALKCTPSYLMGWEDITDANGVEVMAKVPDFLVQLSPDESILIEAYRKDQSFKDMVNRLLAYVDKIGDTQ